jgi:WD40-like Beta Propeller Repeat
MTPPIRRDPDRVLEAFFEPGPRHLSDALAAAIRDDVHHTRQRRGLPRWDGTVSRFAVPLAGLGAVAAAIIAFVLLASNPTDVVAPGSSGTPHASPSTPGSAAPSAELLASLGYDAPGTIAFTRSDPSVGDDTTWLIAPDGSGETQVVVDTNWGGDAFVYPGTGCCLVFSPDGTRVAVGYDDNSGAGGPGNWMQTRILTLDGADVSTIPVVCGGCGSVQQLNFVPRAWSPDGSLLALETWGAREGLALAPVHGDDWTLQLGGNHHDVPVAFSPDGTKLLFVRVTDGARGSLMELDVPDDAALPGGGQSFEGITREVGAPGMLTTIDSYFGAPASWSPDGRQIAFAATDPSLAGDRMRIWVVDADGGEPVPLTSDASIYTGAAWSPDGHWIAFDRDGGFGRHDSFITRPDGSDLTNLTSSFAPGVCCARWSPDSSALLVAGTVSDNTASYLFIVPIDGSPIAQVTTVPGFYQDFSWGPASR